MFTDDLQEGIIELYIKWGKCDWYLLVKLCNMIFCGLLPGCFECALLPNGPSQNSLYYIMVLPTM